jgi:hypothetical protein
VEKHFKSFLENRVSQYFLALKTLTLDATALCCIISVAWVTPSLNLLLDLAVKSLILKAFRNNCS